MTPAELAKGQKLAKQYEDVKAALSAIQEEPLQIGSTPLTRVMSKQQYAAAKAQLVQLLEVNVDRIAGEFAEL